MILQHNHWLLDANAIDLSMPREKTGDWRELFWPHGHLSPNFPGQSAPWDGVLQSLAAECAVLAWYEP